ncbi:MAG: bifunctional 4-hydroxy-2-oxoglutarate aldolase/2-dehydro-3-deoxy-phosphogluconate aldolase [Alphaproteobacteria bacterium]
MSDLRTVLKGHRIIPVVTLADVALALPLAEALLEGGIGIVEITLRSEAGLAVIEMLREELPEMKVGAGTVLTPLLLQRAHSAGAQFFVSPGLSTEMREGGRGLAFLPGVATASEVMEALAGDYTHLKFFPAESAGGIAALKQLGSVFPTVSFCPTGGVDEENMADYLALKNVFAVGGSWLAPADALAARDWKRIRDIARRSVDSIASS